VVWRRWLMLSDHPLSVQCMVFQGVPPEHPLATKVNVSTNIQWTGAIQAIVFGRLATIKRVAYVRRESAVVVWTRCPSCLEVRKRFHRCAARQ
jgi:hypothetical protein